MSTSVVGQVVAAIQNLLNGILAGAQTSAQPPYTFKTQQVKVENFPVVSTDDATSDFLLGVFLQGVSVDETEVRSFPIGSFTSSPTDVIVGIRAVIRTSTENSEADKQNLIDDIQAALYANRNLGITQNAVKLNVITFQNFVYGPNAASMLLTFDALVRVHCLSNPASP